MELTDRTNKKVDVVVVGTGPGGSAAAKKCAEAGLEIVLFEAKKYILTGLCT